MRLVKLAARELRRAGGGTRELAVGQRRGGGRARSRRG